MLHLSFIVTPVSYLDVMSAGVAGDLPQRGDVMPLEAVHELEILNFTLEQVGRGAGPAAPIVGTFLEIKIITVQYSKYGTAQYSIVPGEPSCSSHRGSLSSRSTWPRRWTPGTCSRCRRLRPAESRVLRTLRSRGAVRQPPRVPTGSPSDRSDT